MVLHVKYNTALVLIMIFVATFCLFIAWFLWRACARAITAEAMELRYRGDVEASVGVRDGGASGDGSNGGVG